MSDTIFALSSGGLPAGIAVVRVSGPNAFAAGRALAGALPAPRTAALRALRDPADATLLDRALVLRFAGPASATGEDVVEFHLHGSRAVVRAVETALAALPGLRAAEAGEFTRRAMLNGVLDLTAAEGLAELLAAEGEAHRRAALANAEGGLRALIEGWTEAVVALSAAVEAVIDHDEEDDLADGDTLLAAACAGASALAGEIAASLRRPAVERLGEGVMVVLAGPPNSGKSSLINALVDREVAIVSPVPGTTRDRIEASVVRDGIAWRFVDTAGLVDRTQDPIEAIGVARAREALERADVILWLGDDDPPGDAVAVHPRADLSTRTEVPSGRLAVSSITRTGLANIWGALTAKAERLIPKADAILLNARQRGLCGNAADSLCAAALTHDALIVAEELRAARACFDRVVGKADVEAVLNSIFTRFCIGK